MGQSAYGQQAYNQTVQPASVTPGIQTGINGRQQQYADPYGQEMSQTLMNTGARAP